MLQSSQHKMTRERFISLWGRCVLPGAHTDGGAVYEEIARRYAEPHRRYHTGSHIEFCLRQFDRASGHMDNADAVELALWFHDLIYDTDAADNELKSAQRFLETGEDQLDSDLCRVVYDLILVTIHSTLPARPDEKYVVDIDLSSFGLPWPEFKRDSVSVREEFAHVPDAEFFPKQIRFLNALLARPSFYFTAFFRERQEKTAQENIRRYIEELSTLGYGQ